jgi:hypothetical protein
MKPTKAATISAPSTPAVAHRIEAWLPCCRAEIYSWRVLATNRKSSAQCYESNEEVAIAAPNNRQMSFRILVSR